MVSYPIQSGNIHDAARIRLGQEGEFVKDLTEQGSSQDEQEESDDEHILDHGQETESIDANVSHHFFSYLVV